MKKSTLTLLIGIPVLSLMFLSTNTFNSDTVFAADNTESITKDDEEVIPVTVNYVDSNDPTDILYTTTVDGTLGDKVTIPRLYDKTRIVNYGNSPTDPNYTSYTINSTENNVLTIPVVKLKPITLNWIIKDKDGTTVYSNTQQFRINSNDTLDESLLKSYPDMQLDRNESYLLSEDEKTFFTNYDADYPDDEIIAGLTYGLKTEINSSITDEDNAGATTSIVLQYNEVIDTGENNNNNTTGTDIRDVNNNITTYNDTNLYDINGNKLADYSLKSNTDWHIDKQKTINGVKYYRVSTDAWVNSNDVFIYYDNDTNITTHPETTKTLLRSNNTRSNRGLAPDTTWQSDRYTYFNNQKYYRVSSNEWVLGSSVFEN